MLRNTKSRGFTLIELLVVIAIIGILSAVVLASLNQARQKGADAAIESDLSTVRAQAELYYDDTGNLTYGSSVAAGTCPTATGNMFVDNAQMKAAIADANKNSGGTNARCASDGQNYAVSVPLKSDSSEYWCVDSSGVATKESSALSGTSCNP